MAAPALACFAHLCFITYVCGQFLTTDNHNNLTTNLTELTRHEDSIILLSDSKQNTTTESNIINNVGRNEPVQKNITLMKNTDNLGGKSNLTTHPNLNKMRNVAAGDEFYTNLNKELMEHDRNSENAFERVINSLKVLYGFNDSLKEKSLDDIAINILEEGTKSRTTENYNQFDNERLQNNILRNKHEEEDSFHDYARLHNLINNQSNSYFTNKNEHEFQTLDNSFHLPKKLEISSKHNHKNVTNNFNDNKNPYVTTETLIPHLTTETVLLVDTKDNDDKYEKTNYIWLEMRSSNDSAQYNVTKTHNSPKIKRKSAKQYFIRDKLYDVPQILDYNDDPMRFHLNLSQFAEIDHQTDDPIIVISKSAMGKNLYNPFPLISTITDLHRIQKVEKSRPNKSHTLNQIETKKLSNFVSGLTSQNILTKAKTPLESFPTKKFKYLVSEATSQDIITRTKTPLESFPTKKFANLVSGATSQNILTRAKTPREFFPTKKLTHLISTAARQNIFASTRISLESLPNYKHLAFRHPSSVSTTTTQDPISQFYASVSFPDETYIVSFGIRMICHLKDVQSWEKLHDVAIIFAYEFSIVAEENQDEIRYLGTPIDIAFRDFSQLIRKWNEREARGNLTRYCHQLKNRQYHWHELNLILDHYEHFMDKRAVQYIVQIWETFKTYPNVKIDLTALSIIMRTILNEIFINPFKRVLDDERFIMHRVRRLAWLLNTYAKLVKYPSERIMLQLPTRDNRRRRIRQVSLNNDDVEIIANDSRESRPFRHRRDRNTDYFLNRENPPPIMKLLMPSYSETIGSPQKTSSEDSDDSSASLWHPEKKNNDHTETATYSANLRKSFSHDLKHIKNEHPAHFDKYIRHHFRHHQHKSNPESKIKKYEKIVETFFNDHKKHKKHGNHQHNMKVTRRRSPKTGSYFIDRYIPSTTTTTETTKNAFQNFLNKENSFIGGFLNNMMTKKHSSTPRAGWTSELFPQTSDNVMDMLFSVQSGNKMTTQEFVTPKPIQFSMGPKEYEYHTDGLNAQNLVTQQFYAAGKPGNSYPITSYNDMNTGGKLDFKYSGSESGLPIQGYNDVNPSNKVNIQSSGRESSNLIPEYNSANIDVKVNNQNNGVNTGGNLNLQNIARNSNNPLQDYNFVNSDGKANIQNDGREYNVMNTDAKVNIENSGKGSNNPIQGYNYLNTNNKVDLQNKGSESNNPIQIYNYNTQNIGRELINPIEDYNGRNIGVKLNNHDNDKGLNNPVQEYNYMNPDRKFKYLNNDRQSFNPTIDYNDMNADGKVNIRDISKPIQEYNYMNIDGKLTIQNNDRDLNKPMSDYNNIKIASEVNINTNGKDLNLPGYNNMNTNGMVNLYNSGRDSYKELRNIGDNHVIDGDKLNIQIGGRNSNNPFQEYNYMGTDKKDNAQNEGRDLSTINNNNSDKVLSNRYFNGDYSYINTNGKINIQNSSRDSNNPLQEYNYFNEDGTLNIQNSNSRANKTNVNVNVKFNIQNSGKNTSNPIQYYYNLNNSRELNNPIAENSKINIGGNDITLNIGKQSSNPKDGGYITMNIAPKDIIEMAAREFSNKIRELSHDAKINHIGKAEEKNSKNQNKTLGLIQNNNRPRVVKKADKRVSKNNKVRVSQRFSNYNMTSKTTHTFRSPIHRVHNTLAIETITSEPRHDLMVMDIKLNNKLDSNNRTENQQLRTISDSQSNYRIYSLINKLNQLKRYSKSLQDLKDTGPPRFQLYAGNTGLYTSPTSIIENVSEEIFRERIGKKDFDSYEYALRRPYQKDVDIEGNIFHNNNDRSEVNTQETTTEKDVHLEKTDITLHTNSSNKWEIKGRKHDSVAYVKDEPHQYEQNVNNMGNILQNNKDTQQFKESNYEMIWRVEREKQKLIRKYNKLFSRPKVIRSLINIYSNKMENNTNVNINNQSKNVDTEDILRKITELSSYSDEELSLKLNLHNAFHGKHVLDTRRAHISSESDIPKINVKDVSESEGDIEHVLKQNIYKTFGYDTKLKRLGNDTRRIENIIVPKTWELTPDYFVNLTTQRI